MRRGCVHKRQLFGLAAGALTLLALWSVFVGFGALRAPHAAQAARVAKENRRLRTLLAESRAQIPSLRRHLMRAERLSAQIRSGSGLGVDNGNLGIGPIEGNRQFGQSPKAAAYSSAILSGSAQALPRHAEKLLHKSERLQQNLGELLEYFHDAKQVLSSTPSIRPVQAIITSDFGRRFHPIDNRYMMHKGIDFGGRTGSEIVAPADGIVIYTGWRGGYGKTVVLDHGYGIQTHYAHLSKYRVKTGQNVSRGQTIAEMGSTGHSTGPHVHYEVRRFGHPIDPAKFILD